VTQRSLARALVIAAVLFLPAGALADTETYRLVASDGTVHYTNAPRDPSYQRMGLTPPAPAAPAPAAPPTRGNAVVPRAVPVAADKRDAVAHYAREAAARHGVSDQLVLAVIRAESGFNARAVSPKGARGLMQLMPQTASHLGVRDSFNPAENIDGGVRHLRRLIDRFRNDLPLALAAYNAGEQAVTFYRGIPPYPETQGYVQKVLWLLNGGDAQSAFVAIPVAYPTYSFTEEDGTVVYSNLPPRGTAKLIRR
jgi:soluble lytic murein transglycosylase-like protein